jgi:hypothetical protein
LALGQTKPVEALVSLPTVSLQFAGGSLSDYVKALKEATPNFNIVLAVSEAKDIRLPAIKLDAVSFYPALRLLQGEYRLDDGTIIKLLVNDMGGPREGETANPVYKIWSERQEARKPSPQVQVWNIGELIGPDRKAEDVLTAVETAVGLLPNQDKAKIRYHAETTLVVACGEQDQLIAIERVVDGIRQGVRSEKANRAEKAEKKPQ